MKNTIETSDYIAHSNTYAPRKIHKYVSRDRINGRWKYTYPEDRIKGRKKNITGNGYGASVYKEEKSDKSDKLLPSKKINNKKPVSRKQFYATVIGKPIGTDLKTGESIIGTSSDARQLWKNQKKYNRQVRVNNVKSSIYDGIKKSRDYLDDFKNEVVSKYRVRAAKRYTKQINRWISDNKITKSEARRIAKRVNRVIKWKNDYISRSAN